MTETPSTTTRWKRFDKWIPIVFLIAGGLMFFTTAFDALDAFMDTSTQAVGGIAGFGGIVLSFVGLVGLYPRVAEGATRLTRVGILLVTLPAIFFFVLFAWALFAEFAGLPSLTAMIPSLDIVTGAIFFLFAAGITIFGIVSLRSGVLSRAVGSFLLVFAAAWVVLLSVIAAYGFPIPVVANVIATGAMAVALLAIGYFLRTEPESAARAEPALTEVRHD